MPLDVPQQEPPLKKLLSSLIATTALAAGSASAADVGVSVEISQPGVYGRIDIGRFPQPAVIVPQPVIITPPPRVVAAPPPQPIYMWVPPGHRKNWGKHCREYNACGVPVYFVRHDWYDEHVVRPQRGGKDRDDRGPGRGNRGKGKGHGKGHD
jgi:hypothetical protein